MSNFNTLPKVKKTKESGSNRKVREVGFVAVLNQNAKKQFQSYENFDFWGT